MLLFNRTYNQYVKYFGGLRFADGTTRQTETTKTFDNFYSFGYYQSYPQGYQSATRALIPSIKTSSFIAANLGGAGNFIGSLTGIGNMSATVSGEGAISAGANVAANGFATLAGEGTLSPGLTALGNMEAEINAGAQPSAFDIAQEVIGSVIESGVNLKDVLRILSAVAVGKTMITDLGGGNAEVVFRNISDTTDIVTAQMTGGERNSIIIDV